MNLNNFTVARILESLVDPSDPDSPESLESAQKAPKRKRAPRKSWKNVLRMVRKTKRQARKESKKLRFVYAQHGQRAAAVRIGIKSGDGRTNTGRKVSLPVCGNLDSICSELWARGYRTFKVW